MTLPHEISQRDLRMRSREIMDAVERGDSFTVTRSGHQIGELTPRTVRRKFISRAEVLSAWSTVPAIDPDELRDEMDALVTPFAADPHERQG